MVWSRASWVSDTLYALRLGGTGRYRIDFGFKVLINDMYISGTRVYKYMYIRNCMYCFCETAYMYLTSP